VNCGLDCSKALLMKVIYLPIDCFSVLAFRVVNPTAQMHFSEEHENRSAVLGD